MLKHKKKLLFLTTILLTICLAIGGAFAFLTYRTDKITNTVSLGEIKIELIETDWTSLEDDNQNLIPDIAEHVFPKQTIPKNPKIENTGKNAAFVYLKVTVPKKSVQYINTNGRIVEADDSNPQELFSYEVDTSWTKFMTDSSNPGYNEHYYYYNNKLNTNTSTSPLFNEIVTLDFIEGQVDNVTTSVTVSAYGIQADYKETSNNALLAWNHLAKQQDLRLYTGDAI